ncbi:MAG: hypothetical protein M0Z80_12480 [Treponema sp.]|nr:hypothetical protein [Treponema sp.]
MNNAPRSAKGKLEEHQHITHHVADFLRKFRLALLGILGAVVLVIIVVAIWTAVAESRMKASTLAIENAENELATYQSEQDQTKKTALEKTLVASLDKVIVSWPKLYAAQKAHAIKAQLDADAKDWEGAEKEWVAASNLLKGDFLAPVALQNAAAAAEERGADDKAAGYYKTLLAKYGKNTIGVVHAYFALGRISEESKDYTAAVGYYEKIVAGYPSDDWTKLAKDRILALRSQGLVK